MALDSFIPNDFQARMRAQQAEISAAFDEGANMNAGTVQRLMSIKRNYNWLDAGAALAMAKVGYSGYSPEVHQAAQLSLKKQLRDDQFQKLMNTNDISDLKNINSAVFNSFSPAQKKQAQKKFGSLAEDAFGGGGLDIGYSLSRLSRGDITGGILGGGHETRTPGDTGVASPIQGTGTDILKGAAREGLTAANTGIQAVQGYVRTKAAAIGELAGGNLAAAPAALDPTGAIASTESYAKAAAGSGSVNTTPLGQTDVGQQIKAAVEGRDPMATGNGILPDPNSPIGQAQSAAARQTATIAGHGLTLGRVVAAGLHEIVPTKWTEPESPTWNVLSGLVDAGVTMKADPVAAVMNEYSAARNRQEFFQPPTTAPPPPEATGAGMLDSAMRRTQTSPVMGGERPLTSDIYGPYEDTHTEFTAERYGLKAKQWDKLYRPTADTTDEISYLNEIQRIHGTAVRDEVAAELDARAHYNDAQTLFDNTGLGIGGRASVAKNTAEAFINSPKNQQIFDSLAKMTSPSDIWRMTGKKFDNATATAFAAAKTPEEAKQVVLDHLGSPGMMGPFSVPTPGGNLYTFKRGLDNHVATMMMPDVHYLQPLDRESTVRALDDYMGSAHINVDTRQQILDAYMNAPNHEAALQAVDTASSVLREQFIMHGASETQADELSRLFPRTAKIGYDYDARLISDPHQLELPLVSAGTGEPIPSAELSSQYANTSVPLPDATAARRAASKYAPLFNHPAYRGTSAILDTFMQQVWKPVHLIRPALGLRVFLDSQLSLAANGYQSLFNHPVDYISMLIGAHPDSFLGKVPGIGIHPSYIYDALGEPIIDPSNYKVMNSIWGGMAAYQDPTRIAMSKTREISILEPDGAKAAVQQLQRLRGDYLVKQIVNMTPAEAQQWFYEGEGKALRESLIDPVRAMNNSSIAYGSPLNIDLETPMGSDAFIHSLYDQISQKTGNHADLVDSLRTGDIRGVPMWKGNHLNRHAVNQMKSIIDEEMTNPGIPTRPGMEGMIGGVPYERSRAYAYEPGMRIHGIETPAQPQLPMRVNLTTDQFLTRSQKAKDIANKDKAMEYLFNAVLTNPDVKFDRYPALMQAYWGSVDRSGAIENYMPYLSAADRGTLLDNAARSNLPDEVMRRLNSIPINGTMGVKQIPLHLVHESAQSDALDHIVNLVHDLHSRSQFADMTRLIFPFGDAFRRIAVRWAKTVWENPQSLHRFQQGVTAARQSGFFHKDPATGQEVFTIPGTQWLTDKLIGVPVPMSGQVKGLSMVGEGMPGMGPAITIPAQWFLPDTPQFDGVRKLIWPFGAPPKSTDKFQDIIGTVAPSWLSKVVNGPPDQKTYNNTVGSVAAYLASTGDYNLHGANASAETARLLSDAKDKARWLYIIRGVAQAVAPTSPSPEYSIRDKTGHLQVLSIVRKNYYDHAYGKNGNKALGPDGAMQWLMQHYGPDNLFIAQPFSAPVGYAVPVTKEGQDWARNNPDIKSKYPSTYGFFAPSTGKFDINAFEDQFATGERTSYTPEEQAKRANSRVGLWLFHKMRDQIYKSNGGDPLTKDQSTWLAGYKNALAKDYPGFNLVTYDTSRLPKAVSELTDAAKNPKLSGTDAGQGLQSYLKFRKEAMDEAVNSYELSSPFKARAAMPLRVWLRGAAQAIIKDHPDFAPMWEQVWSHEMASDVGVTNG